MGLKIQHLNRSAEGLEHFLAKKQVQNADSPIGTPRSLKLGMLDDGIEVGNKDVSLGLLKYYYYISIL